MWARCRRRSASSARLAALALAFALALLGGVAGGGASGAAPGPEKLLLVAGADSPLARLTLAEARQLWLGDRAQLPSGDPVILTMRPTGSAEKDLFLRKVVGMTEREFRQHWIARVYRGEAQGPPLVLESDLSVQRYLSRQKTALGYLRGGAPTDGLKVLLVVD